MLRLAVVVECGGRVVQKARTYVEMDGGYIHVVLCTLSLLPLLAQRQTYSSIQGSTRPHSIPTISCILPNFFLTLLS